VSANLLNGQHSSGSAEWWTPPELVDPARGLWPFDLDPASCADANRQIGAALYFDASQDGLSRPWDARTVWCNPPSKRGENSAWEWWLKAGREWIEGRVLRLFFVVFNPSSFFAIALEKARAAGLPTPQQAARVEFAARVRYLKPATSLGLPDFDAHAVRGEAPPHGSALLFLGAGADEDANFIRAYAHVGDGLLPFNRCNRRAA